MSRSRTNAEELRTSVLDSDIGTTVLAPDGDGSALTGISALPSQSSQSGKFLTTNGSAASWATVASGATSINGLSDGYNDNSSLGLGTNALANDDGSANLSTAVGTSAMTTNTTGYHNAAIGSFALQANTTGYRHVSVGAYSLYFNTTSNSNTASGYKSMFDNTTGSNNAAYGTNSLENNTTGGTNTAIGYDALKASTTAHSNTATGNKALFSNTVGTRNTASGHYSGYGITTGTHNTFCGAQSGQSTSTGVRNTAIGNGALISTTTGNYNTAIGSGAVSSSNTASGQFTLGDNNVTTLRCNQQTISSLSDQRDKTEIVDSPYGLAFINTVQPRKFKWATREGNIKDGSTNVGFIAQELLVACDGENDVLDLVMDDNPEKLEAKYGNLLPIAVQAIKELSAQNEALKIRLTALENA